MECHIDTTHFQNMIHAMRMYLVARAVCRYGMSYRRAKQIFGHLSLDSEYDMEKYAEHERKCYP